MSALRSISSLYILFYHFITLYQLLLIVIDKVSLVYIFIMQILGRSLILSDKVIPNAL